MQNTDETKKRMIALLQTKGPSLPIQISRELKMSTLFISAFLSELKDEKRLKMSNLKVGGTPLYLLEGQEPLLENFQQYLHPKEQEALGMLKKNKILKDASVDPAIRVALRSIKDFSFHFKNDNEIYWRFLTVTEEEVKNILEPKQNKSIIEETKSREDVSPKPLDVSVSIFTNKIKQEDEIARGDKENKVEPIKIIQPIEIIPEEKKIEPLIIEKREEKEEIIKVKSLPEEPKPEKKKPLKIIEEEIKVFENPLALKPKEPKPEKIKPKSEFVLKVISFLENNKFTIIEEKEHSKKEYSCITQIKTDLGPIDFLTQAKDKKSICDSDLDLLLRKAQTIPLPALMLFPGILNKKALEYEKRYYSILKTKKITS